MKQKSIAKLSALTICFLALNICSSSAQKSIKEYVEKSGKEVIKKSIQITDAPMTAGGYGDGHGRLVLMTDVNQLPDTIALITFHVYDHGTLQTSSSKTTHAAAGITTTQNWSAMYALSPAGGNKVANNMHASAISNLKEAYKKQGVVLLTPEEYLNTPEKRDYYYNKFVPNASKIGDFLTSLEGKGVDMVMTADYYRLLLQFTASDYLRAESLGASLAKKLGVDAVLSVAIELVSDAKNVNMTGIKMTLNGPNLIPKTDKKYIGQKLGTGYYEGQVYTGGNFFFKKPILIGEIKKKNLENLNSEGLGIIFEGFAEKMQEAMRESIAKAAQKYKK